jgi:hypothetical protein
MPLLATGTMRPSPVLDELGTAQTLTLKVLPTEGDHVVEQ